MTQGFFLDSTRPPSVSDCLGFFIEVAMQIELIRYAYNPRSVMGYLICPGLKLFTIERPWKNNEPFVSCIPTGQYRVTRRHSEKFGDHWLLLDVPERSLILIHVANYASELQGCIGIGTGQSIDKKRLCHMVTNSRKAMERFNDLLADETEFQLIIRGFHPEYP